MMLVCLTVLFSAFSAVPAGAATNTYVEEPCAGEESTWPGWIAVDAEQWEAATGCPHGFIFMLIEDGHAGDPEGVYSLVTEESQIESVSAVIDQLGEVPPGIEVGLQACRFNECGTLVVGTGAYDPIEIVPDERDPDVEIPDGANRLRIRLRCTLSVCPAQTPILLADLSIVRSDDTPPYVDAFEMNLISDPDPDVDYDEVLQRRIEPPVWNRGRIYPGAEHEDPESPLEYVRFQIGDISLCAGARENVYVPDCPMYEPSSGMPRFFASDLQDGHNTFTVTAYNRAGLSASDSFAVKTDATLPARPAQFRLSPRFNGWVGGRDVQVQWENFGETVETETQSGIVGYRYDVSPYRNGDHPPPPDVIDPPEQYVVGAAAHAMQYRFPSNGEWTISVRTVDGAGNVSDPGEAYLNIDNGRLVAPELEPIEPINAADAQSGRTISWTYPELPDSGVCGHDYAFSSVSGFNPGEDPATPSLTGSDLQLALTPPQVQALSEKPQKLHLRGYSCAGVPGELVHQPVVVDLTPPTITLAPGGGTVGSGEPILIDVADHKSGTIQSGVDAVSCAIAAEPVDCSTQSGVSLREGENHLVVTATDLAGNSSSATADYLADSTPPTGWFEDPSPADPTHVRAAARDSGAGLATATIEIQAAAGGPWTQIGSGLAGSGPSSEPAELTARIPDDGQLADGEYRLRMRLRDAAGNGATVARTASGAEATFRIPSRGQSSMTAGLTRAGAVSSDGLTRRTIEYGANSRLVGRLTGAGGTPVGGALVTVTASQAGSPPQVFAVATTRPDGTYAVPVGAGATRSFVVRFAGSLSTRPTTAAAKLLVRGKVTLKTSRDVVRSRRSVVLSGRVFFDGASLPLRGKAVELEFVIKGRSSRWKQTTRTDAAGRFQFVLRYPAARRAARFTVRAIATIEPSWAFETAVSQKQKFVVKP
ncbi:MAG: carboxypeptidase regulatory-like domain-containing protein [Thermoleophilaceae bacterium]|nr:carboxypeptidase regulatory-like domain-containing protein [Thermoleophilaceae bacterium]